MRKIAELNIAAVSLEGVGTEAAETSEFLRSGLELIRSTQWAVGKPVVLICSEKSGDLIRRSADAAVVRSFDFAIDTNSDSLRKQTVLKPLDGLFYYVQSPNAERDVASQRMVKLRVACERILQKCSLPVQPVTHGSGSWWPYGLSLVASSIWLLRGYIRMVLRLYVAPRKSPAAASLATACILYFSTMVCVGTIVALVILPRVIYVSRDHLPMELLIGGHNRSDYFRMLSHLESGSTLSLKNAREHVELSYRLKDQYGLPNSDEGHMRYVLSPDVAGDHGWSRRTLWLYLYPRIRNVRDPMLASEAVVTLLRERIAISDSVARDLAIHDTWMKGIANPLGFQVIYVAALRSVGIGARLRDNKVAEIRTADGWVEAPPVPDWELVDSNGL